MNLKVQSTLLGALIALILTPTYSGFAQGFPATASNWSLPAGGEQFNGTNHSFRAIAYDSSSADDLGSQSWTVMDMNGDSKLDLVVYEAIQTGFTGVYSPNSNPYWKVYLGNGSSFSQTATNWNLPAGGEKYNGINYSFRNISYNLSSADDIGSQSWVVMDMNGDSKPDMVVYEQMQTSITSVFSPTSNPYWKVYLNTGTGFSQTATNWALPAGGEKYNGTNYSFHEISYNTSTADDLGSQSWTVMDMNGDSKLDLVIYEENQTSISAVFNASTNPYWKVYLNTGSGFSATAINWSLPSGGEKYNSTNYSFRAISYDQNSADDLGSQSWVVMDMNGDAKPDLVVYEQNQTNGIGVFSPTANPYWKIYLNSTSGFSQTATNWGLPAGGEKYNGTNYSFRAIGYDTASFDDLGSQSWSIMDINGDSKPDLVIYEQKQSNGITVFNPTANPYWKVYANTGSGFSFTATNWSLPSGGEKYNSTIYSFRAISYDTASFDDMGSQSWSVMDMNGDARPDLVVYEEKQANGIGVFSPTHWKVYLNSGNLSTPSQQLQNTVVAYPNPITDQLNVQVNANLVGQSYIISDINGRTIQNGVLLDEANAINFSNVTTGIYFLKLDNQKAVKLIKR